MPARDDANWTLRLENETDEAIDISMDVGLGTRAGVTNARCQPAALAAKLAELRPQASGILPPMLRWVSPTGMYSLLERPPGRRTIRFCPTSKYEATEEKTKSYDIALPWTVYGIGLAQDMRTPAIVMVYFARHQLMGLDDQLYMPALSNVHGDGRFCLPSVTNLRRNLSGAVMAGVEVVWSSDYNLDMDDAARRYREAHRPAILWSGTSRPRSMSGFLRAWSRLSLQEVMNIEDWIAPPSYHHSANGTVGGLIQLLNDYETSMHSLHSSRLANTIRTAMKDTKIQVQEAI